MPLDSCEILGARAWQGGAYFHEALVVVRMLDQPDKHYVIHDWGSDRVGLAPDVLGDVLGYPFDRAPCVLTLRRQCSWWWFGPGFEDRHEALSIVASNDRGRCFLERADGGIYVLVEGTDLDAVRESLAARASVSAFGLARAHLWAEGLPLIRQALELSTVPGCWDLAIEILCTRNAGARREAALLLERVRVNFGLDAYFETLEHLHHLAEMLRVGQLEDDE